MSAKQTILFVCTGNTCRSPMAAALLQKHLPPNSAITVASAGIHAAPNQPATPLAVQVVREFKCDLTPHRSQLLSRELVAAASLIIVMTQAHHQTLLMRWPEAAQKTFLLKNFYPHPPTFPDLADPYGGNEHDYRVCRDQILHAIPGLLLTLKEIP